jgi:hypothetical protein
MVSVRKRVKCFIYREFVQLIKAGIGAAMVRAAARAQ